MFTAFAAVLILLALAGYYASHYTAWDNTPEEMTASIVFTLINALAGALEATVVAAPTATSHAGVGVGYAVGVWICVVGVLGFVLDRILVRKGRPKGFGQWLPYIGIGLLSAGFIAGGIFQFIALA